MDMLLSVVIIALLVIAIFLIIRKTTRPETQLETQIPEIGSIKTRLDDLKDLFDKSKTAVDEIKTTLKIEKDLREKEQSAIMQIQRILTNTSQLGKTGEAIIGEALKHFPQNMIEHNFKVGSSVVEFGLKFLDGKVMPIDSKFRATSLVNSLDKIEDTDERKKIIESIDKEVVSHVMDVGRKYIDPKKTLPFAIAAIPDSVYALCTKAHAEARKYKVVLMPYSMAIPYLLTVYELRIQYSRSINIEKVENALTAMDIELEKADDVITDSFYRGLTMIKNGVSKIEEIIGRVKHHIAFAKETPNDELEIKVTSELPEVEKVKKS